MERKGGAAGKAGLYQIQEKPVRWANRRLNGPRWMEDESNDLCLTCIQLDGRVAFYLVGNVDGLRSTRVTGARVGLQKASKQRILDRG